MIPVFLAFKTSPTVSVTGIPSYCADSPASTTRFSAAIIPRSVGAGIDNQFGRGGKFGFDGGWNIDGLGQGRNQIEMPDALKPDQAGGIDDGGRWRSRCRL